MDTYRSDDEYKDVAGLVLDPDLPPEIKFEVARQIARLRDLHGAEVSGYRVRILDLDTPAH